MLAKLFLLVCLAELERGQSSKNLLIMQFHIILHIFIRYFNPTQRFNGNVSWKIIPQDRYGLHKGLNVSKQTPLGIAWTNFAEGFSTKWYVILPIIIANSKMKLRAQSLAVQP
jgi:hypothetical protein